MKILILADTNSLHKLPGSKSTFIQECVEMFLKYTKRSDLYIQCPSEIKDKLFKHLGDYQFICEPFQQGTSAAIGFGITHIFTQNPHEKVLIAYSDLPVNYQHNLFQVLTVVQQLNDNMQKVILIGVNPTFPATEYGYIKIGKVISEIGSTVAFEMEEFHEKPNLAGAKKFCQSWQYLWNTGYLLGTAQQILDIYKKTLPEDYRGLKTIKESLNSSFERDVIKTIYPTLTKKSIDKAIYEKIHNDGIAVVAVDLNINSFI